jgi:HD-GYP domain-containing protein (c-di-GMP phosphodiesterase class II)
MQYRHCRTLTNKKVDDVIEFRNLDDLSPGSADDQNPAGSDVESSEPVAEPAPLPGQASNADARAEALYERARAYLRGVFDAIKKKEKFTTRAAAPIVRAMVEDGSGGDALLSLAINRDDPADFIIGHGVNVAVLAVRLAAALGFDRQAQTHIGLAALLHDVGTAMVPERIMNKREPLSDAERQVLQDRPKHSHQICKTLGDANGRLADIAIQVYERIDGSGYPQGLHEDEIHEYAKVIGMVDVYEALLHSRPHRPPFLPFAAVKELITTGKNRYPRRHLKALLSTFSIFPIYSCVRLNSGAIGRVMETYADQPMRPRIQIICDSQNRKVLTERIVNLLENPLLYIVDSVSEKELSAGSDG